MLLDYKKNLAKNKQIYLKIKVSPGSAKDVFQGELSDGTLRIFLRAKPEKGLANKALVRFLSKELEIDSRDIKIISGAGERRKLIRVSL